MSKLSTNSLKAVQKPRKCPKCGKIYIRYPALSRVDNETEICPECGIHEAVEAYTKIYQCLALVNIFWS